MAQVRTGELVAGRRYRPQGIASGSAERRSSERRCRAMMIAPASSMRPRRVVIEATRCCDQLHWNSTSSPLGSFVNGATATQPTKPQLKARNHVGMLRGPTDRRSTRLIASGTIQTKWCNHDTGATAPLPTRRHRRRQRTARVRPPPALVRHRRSGRCWLSPTGW